MKSIFRVPIEAAAHVGAIRAMFPDHDIGYSLMEDTNNREDDDYIRVRITVDGDDPETVMDALKKELSIPTESGDVRIQMLHVCDLDDGG